jgi:excisionase family DNA binding protein
VAIEIRESFISQPRLLLSKEEAARALGISMRTLTGLMARNEIPGFFRLGRRVLFSAEAIRAWIAEKVKGSSGSQCEPRGA